MKARVIGGKCGHADPADDYSIVAVYDPQWEGRAFNRILPVHKMPRDAIWQVKDGDDIWRPVFFFKTDFPRWAA